MQGILALELTEDKINILELALTPKGFETLHLNNIETPKDSIREGIITEPKVIADRIAKFIRENSISSKKAVCLIDPNYVFTRIIRLPHNLTDSQIRLNLEVELNQYRPFSSKEVVIDFNKLEEISEEGTKKINVLFAATFKALSESYLKTMELAGLDLVAIDTPILCLMRALDEVDLKASSLEASLLILISRKHIEICILKGNRPRFLHSVELEVPDLAKGGQADFVDRLLSAIKLVVNFYQTRLIQGEEISRIIINPLDAQYNQIHTLLQEKLTNVPIKASDILSRIFIDSARPINLDELKFSFSCLFGAALRLEGRNQPFNLNLLLEQKAKKTSHLTQLYLIIISLSLVFSIAIISMFWFIIQITVLQGKISQLDSQLKRPPQELNKIIAIRGKNNTLNKRINEASQVTSKLNPPLYFKNIAKAMVLVPQDLWLTEVSLDAQDKKLILNGSANAEKPIFNYISSLSDSAYFDNVELLSSRGEIGRLEFTIQCKLK